MIGAIVTSSPTSFTVQGDFRGKDDLAGMKWETEDQYSHQACKYPTNRDFTNVVLEYQYEISGMVVQMDSGRGSSLTVTTMDGSEYYVRLWNYVTNRPLDAWEQETGTLFPAGRTPGGATGESGQIRIDFMNYMPDGALWIRIGKRPL